MPAHVAYYLNDHFCLMKYRVVVLLIYRNYIISFEKRFGELRGITNTHEVMTTACCNFWGLIIKTISK